MFNKAVAIGTDTSTEGKLHIKQSDDTYQGAIAIEGTGGGHAYLFHNASNCAVLQKGTNANHLVLDNNGNVGIGAASPSSALDVAGDIEIGSTDAFYYGDPLTDGTYEVVRSGDNLDFNQRETGVYNTKFFVSGASIGVNSILDLDGNSMIEFGTGECTHTGKLHVKQTGDVSSDGATVEGVGGGTVKMYHNASNQGVIQKGDNTGQITLNNDGSVSFATGLDHSAFTNLDWASAGHTIADNTPVYFNTANTVGIRYLTSTTPDRLQILANFNEDIELQVSGTGKVIFGDAGNAYILDNGNIITSGDVCIGTDTTEQPDGSVSKVAIVEDSVDSIRMLSLLQPDLAVGQWNTLGLGRTTTAKDSAWIGFVNEGVGSSDNYLTFGLYGLDNIMTLTGNGFVGLGTATPGVILDIKQSEPNFIKLDRTSNEHVNGVFTIGVSFSATNDEFVFIGPGTNQSLVVDDGGFVGIGTNAPDRLLHIKGANACIHIEREDMSPPSFFWSHVDGANTTHWRMEAIHNSGGAGSGVLNISDDGTASGGVATIRMTIDDSGNVGINKATNITSKLQVVGLAQYADNTAAAAGGLTAGSFYRTGDLLKVVH